MGTPQTNACIGPTPPPTAISSLIARCQELLVHGLAPSTRRSYSTGQRRFINFCAQIGKLHDNGSACPADEWTLCLFAAFLSSQVKHATIKVYLSAVRALHIELGFADPLLDALRLERVIRGIRRSQGSTKADRLPVTDDIMRLIHTHLDFRIVDHLMFWAACCLAYFGFLRSAEFPVPSLQAYSPVYNLNVSDISVDALDQPTCIRVNIKASKTDTFRKGCLIYIGKARPPLYAVEALLKYLAVRGVSSGPLFLLQSRVPLSRTLITSWLRDNLMLANVPGNYSSHSFRIGAATVAARNGIPDHLIQTMVRWSSDAYKTYIRTPASELTSASAKLC